MIFIKNSIRLFFILVLFFLFFMISDQFTSAYWTRPSDSILKIYSYEQGWDGYFVDKFGSAMVIGQDTLITNAHVVAREDDTTYNNYEICGHIDDDKKIICFTTAKIVYIDVEKDLAILKFYNQYKYDPVVFSDKESKIWDGVTVYGYSFDGFGNITASQGIVSNYYNNYVWLDADIDQWDSGGWVLDNQGRVVGMPTFILLYNILGDIKKSNYMIPAPHITKFIKSRNQKPDDKLSSYYNTSDYNKFVSYISHKQKQQSLWYIKTSDFYLWYKWYGFAVSDATKWSYGYDYVLKNTNQDVEIYLSKYIWVDIQDKLSYYDQLLGDIYDDIKITDLSTSIKSSSISDYTKIVARDDDLDEVDTIHLLQKWDDLIFLEIYGDEKRQDYKIFYRKLENMVRMMIWR